MINGKVLDLQLMESNIFENCNPNELNFHWCAMCRIYDDSLIIIHKLTGWTFKQNEYLSVTKSACFTNMRIGVSKWFRLNHIPTFTIYTSVWVLEYSKFLVYKKTDGTIMVYNLYLKWWFKCDHNHNTA